MNKIPLLDLKRQYLEIKKEIDSAANKVLESGQYVLGGEAAELEKEIAAYCGVKHAVGVASGTDALLLSLKSLGIKRGDEVIVPDFSFFATAGVVSRLGARPVFVDINPLTFNINPDLLKEKITEKTKAIIPVHLFGQTADMDKIINISDKYNLKVVEDACQALGAEYNGVKAGGFGDTAAFSFFPSKNLGCYGDGGMILTNDDNLYEDIKKLRVHGAHPKYYHQKIGYNSRLDEIQAAVLRVKLKYLDQWNKKRQLAAEKYNSLFNKYELTQAVKLPRIKEGNNHVFHQYLIKVDRRDEIKKRLMEKGISTSVYYPLPLHLQKCFKDLAYKKGDFPAAEDTCNKVLALPIDPLLNEKEVEYVVKNIKSSLDEFSLKKNIISKKNIHKEKLIKKIKNKTAVVGVVGLGYVGLPLAVEKAKAGYKTVGFDINKKKIKMVNNGKNYIGDVIPEDLSKLVEAKMLGATSDYSFITDVDTLAVCVPTPLDKYLQPDTSYLRKTAGDIAKYIHEGVLVILESTTYPGTTEELVKTELQKSGLKVGEDFFLAFSPERVDPGNKLYNVKNTPKVVGGITDNCTELAALLYENILEGEVHRVSSPAVAEMEKILENTYRNINIALVNEMALLCEKMNINIWEVIEAAGTKPYGFVPFYPGPGVGGHCIPIDPFYLTWKAREYNYHTRLIELAGEINSYMPQFVYERTVGILNEENKTVNGAKILLLGLAYKQDIDDLRESPALKVFKVFKKNKAQISYNDPFIPEIKIGGVIYKSLSLTKELLKKVDLVIITTMHSSYDYEFIQKHAPYIFDTKNAMKAITDRSNIELL